MRAARALAVVAAGVAGACGLFPDVSPLESDAGVEAGVDANGSDARADAPIDAAEASTSPCDAQHTFCDDFDTGALGAKWDSTDVESGPMMLATTAVSPPYSLEAQTSSSGETTALVKHFDAANHTHVEFDALVQTPGNVSNTEVDLFSMVFDDAPAPYNFAVVDFQRWEGESQIEEYVEAPDGGSAGQDLPFTEIFASWHHVALDFDFTQQSFTAAVDGVVVQAMSLDPTIPETGYSVSLGVAYVNDKDGWSVFIDNFTLDQSP